MKSPIYATDLRLLVIGRLGENGAQPVVFNIADWIREFGSGGTVALMHKRSTDTDAYLCTITNADGVITWVPTSGDLACVGYGEAELRYSKSGVVVKSRIWQTQTLRALDPSATAPSPWQSYVDAVATNANKAEAAADAIENMTVGAETSDTTTVTKTIVDDVVHLQFGLQKGQKGDTGAKGDKGDPTDVRINNKSVVTDGVANIKLYSNSLQYNQSGISIPQTPQNRIDNRSQNSAVTTDRINHAVKAALTDGRHMTLTEDEQATAKEVLGVTDPAPLTKEAIDEALETDIVEDVGDLETALSTHEANTTDAHGIDVVKSHLNNLTPTESPVVGKVLKVKSVNADGTFVCEWADSAQGTDVQINGTSITADGVANIPLADSTVTGAVKLGSVNQSGLSSYNGNVVINSAVNAQIDARNTGVRPIVPYNLNYAVKAALTDAKRIGHNGDAELTSAEMDNACGVLGAQREKRFEFIASTTLDADTQTLNIRSGNDGNPFSLTKAKMIIKFALEDTAYDLGTPIFCIYNSNVGSYTQNSYGYLTTANSAIPAKNSYGTNVTYIVIDAEINGIGYVDISGDKFTYNTYHIKNGMFGVYNKMLDYTGKTFNIASIFCPAGKVLKAGTEIKLYGIRA